MASEVDPVAPTAATIQLLTVKEVAAALGIHRRTVWTLAARAAAGDGTFPQPVRLGPKSIRWRLADVQRYIDGLAGEGRTP